MDVECDVLVVGGTPAGVAAAVQAARDDRAVRLVTYNDHLGGMMASGLSMTDTLLHPQKGRSPILDEFFERIRDHYRTTYGEDSEQYETCNDGMFFEPHVAEKTFERLVDAEGTLFVDRGWHPVSVSRNGRSIRSVAFESFESEETRTIAAEAYVDATYEGDFAATAGVSYHVGREPTDEYGERFAGRVFTAANDVSRLRAGSTGEGDDLVQAYNYRICLSCDPDNRRYPEKPDSYDREEYLWILHDIGEMRAYLDEKGVEDPMSVGLESRTSPELATAMRQWYRRGAGHPTEDDENRWVPLDADVYRGEDPAETQLFPLPAETSLLDRSIEEIADGLLDQTGDGFVWGKLPNDKRDLNACDLVGESHEYPEADWTERREIAKRHLDYVVGFLYFLQNDEAVPDPVQEQALEWGLAADEFSDNDNLPFQLYVREARRIEGRETFTERDAFLGQGLERAPINDSSVGIAEFPLDPHDVGAVRRTNSAADGRFFLTEATVPSQIPYGSIVPEGIDDMLVPVALSASHVGFQTVRLEPTWFQLGEAAGVAAAQSIHADATPGTLDVPDLQRTLVEAGWLLSYFVDSDPNDEPWSPAIQFLGTKGCFDGYDARPTDPLDATTAAVWAETAADLLAGDVDSAERARSLPGPDQGTGETVGTAAFVADIERKLEERDVDVSDLQKRIDSLDVEASDRLTRGEACRIVYQITG